MSAAVRRGSGRPTKGYYAADGERVPATTTINGRYGDKEGLHYWFKRTWYDGAKAGLAFDDIGYDDANIGTLVHRLIEAQIHETAAPEIPADLSERVSLAFSAFIEWLTLNKLTITATEIALVSEAHRYGGTVDAIIRDSQGRLALGDWKSSKTVRGEYLRQLAAYGELWNETQDEVLTGGFHVIRFSKTKGDIEHRWFPELVDELRMFLLLREAYEMDKSIQKRAA